MHGLFRLFQDKNGELHGWRILGMFTVIAMLVCSFIYARSVGDKEQLKIMCVVAVLVIGTGLFLTLIDHLRRAEARRDARKGIDHVRQAKHDQLLRFHRNCRAFAICGLLVIPAAAVAIMYAIYFTYASAGWPSTQGTVQSIQVIREFKSYSVNVRMRYEVQGTTYRQTLSPTGLSTVKFKNKVQQLEATFAEGTIHSVYFDPDKPSRASLTSGPGLGTIIGTVCVLLVAFCLFMVCVQTIRQPSPVLDDVELDGSDWQHINTALADQT